MLPPTEAADVLDPCFERLNKLTAGEVESAFSTTITPNTHVLAFQQLGSRKNLAYCLPIWERP